MEENVSISLPRLSVVACFSWFLLLSDGVTPPPPPSGVGGRGPARAVLPRGGARGLQRDGALRRGDRPLPVARLQAQRHPRDPAPVPQRPRPDPVAPVQCCLMLEW